MFVYICTVYIYIYMIYMFLYICLYIYIAYIYISYIYTLYLSYIYTYISYVYMTKNGKINAICDGIVSFTNYRHLPSFTWPHQWVMKGETAILSQRWGWPGYQVDKEALVSLECWAWCFFCILCILVLLLHSFCLVIPLWLTVSDTPGLFYNCRTVVRWPIGKRHVPRHVLFASLF